MATTVSHVTHARVAPMATTTKVTARTMRTSGVQGRERRTKPGYFVKGRTEASKRCRGMISASNEANSLPEVSSNLDRRTILMGTSLLAAAGLVPPQAYAAGDAAKFATLAKEAVDENVTASWEICLKALLHDAATYDKATKTGGINGSLQFEMDRPENAILKEVVEQVSAVKAVLDASDIVLTPISWSDTLVLTGLIKTTACFKDSLCSKVKEGACDIAYQAYGNKPPTPKLGRIDAVSADATGLIPADGASAAEFKAMFDRMGLTKTDLCLLAPALTGDYASGDALLRADPQFVGIMDGLEKAKRDITRTSYEVPFYRAYIKIASLGAKFVDKVGYFQGQ
eukprot:CAMPEP_0118923128 /NCGR_PEP_ID=MMETSP1169-20130426/1770_1 /TAXON_ID=36882 /ORGANISM="Pyramimonas obovata, Strain CCMP722" /LENGTH=341 /DNA_ID=CAMNT_0006864073 /DNA_START=65 /DNA_END=1090 /DNA_ORIENTATION=+